MRSVFALFLLLLSLVPLSGCLIPVIDEKADSWIEVNGDWLNDGEPIRFGMKLDKIYTNPRNGQLFWNSRGIGLQSHEETIVWHSFPTMMIQPVLGIQRNILVSYNTQENDSLGMVYLILDSSESAYFYQDAELCCLDEYDVYAWFGDIELELEDKEKSLNRPTSSIELVIPPSSLNCASHPGKPLTIRGCFRGKIACGERETESALLTTVAFTDRWSEVTEQELPDSIP